MDTELDVLTRCESTHNLFKIVFQQQGSGWDAYRVLVPRTQPRPGTPEPTEGNQGAPAAPIMQGTIGIDPAYKGCPFCHARSFYTCGTCGRLVCWDNRLEVVCPWCSAAAEVRGRITQLTGNRPTQGGPRPRPRPVGDPRPTPAKVTPPPERPQIPPPRR